MWREEQANKLNNLFGYATSELSQDAFICWLISHATEAGWNNDPKLRECAILFLNKILTPKNTIFKDNTRVTEVKKQYKKIDILVQLDEFRIIFEDKTFTKLHSNQIMCYKNALIEEGTPEDKIICVFYKIEEQPNPEKDVDFEFTWEILLDIFRPYKETIQNQIFRDYLEYLEWIDYNIKSFRNQPIRNWSRQSYVGLFNYLSNNMLKSQNIG